MGTCEDHGASAGLAEALRSYRDLDFVAEIQGKSVTSPAFTLHCSTKALTNDLACDSILLTASDCVNGVFRRKLCDKELDEVRHTAGMDGFSWDSFLVLFFAALRNEQRCSCTIENTTFGSTSIFLKLDFSLHSMMLSSKLELLAAVPVPGPELEVKPYLEELNRFVLNTLRAVRTTSSASWVGNSASNNPVSQSLPLLDFGTLGNVLPSQTSSTSQVEASGISLGVRKTTDPFVRASTPAMPKKRHGSLLVTPGAVKPRVGNPFRLGA